jgi:V/A-type H+-transporting ATPase subunit E
MSIESLVGKIIEDARRTSSEIEERALGEVKACEAIAEREAQAVIDAARERAIHSARERKKRLISMAELENRKEILRVKQEMIEGTFEGAIERILSLDTGAYGCVLNNLIFEADPEGGEEILLNQRDRDRLGTEWLDRLNRGLGEKGRKGGMRLAKETRPIRGGAILRRGRKEINCSLESVIGSKRNALETTVAGILFGNRES